MNLEALHTVKNKNNRTVRDCEERKIRMMAVKKLWLFLQLCESIMD